MKNRKYLLLIALCISTLLTVSTVEQADAYKVTLSLYNQGFNLNAFYDNGNFDVEKGIVEADPTSLMVIVGDPANVEDVLEVPEVPDPFQLADAGSDFHFEIAQPFRFQNRFNGLFSTSVDDPVLLVPDNGTVVGFQDDVLLADDRINLEAYAAELPDQYYEVDKGDMITMLTDDGTKLFITGFWRNPDFTITINISDVPEPGTIVLLGLGFLVMMGIVRRKKSMNLKKIFPLLIVVMVMLLTTMLYPVNIYALEIGPSFCAYISQPICTQFQEAYDPALGQPIDSAEGSGSSWAQNFEKGYITCNIADCYGYSKIQDPVKVAIMKKWHSLKDKGIDIGEPTSDIVGAWGSPFGTGGHVRFFGNGDIYYHGNGPRAGQVFEVHGRIYGTYNSEGGTGSFLGFPISDEEPDGPFDHPVNYFEGGCITSENGIDYDKVIKGCKKGEPVKPPQLIEADAQCVTCKDEDGKTVSLNEQIGNFKFTWDSYVPSNPELTFTPSEFDMSTYFFDFMTEEAEVSVRAKVNSFESGPVTDRLILVNEKYELGAEFEITSQSNFLSGDAEFLISVIVGPYKFTFRPEDITEEDFWYGTLKKEVRKKIDPVKREEILKIIDSVDGFDEVLKQIVNGTAVKLVERLEKFKELENVFSTLSSAGGYCEREKKPTFGINVGYSYSKSCCGLDGVKGKHQGTFGGSGTFFETTCDSPSITIYPGVSAGFTAAVGLNLNIAIKGATTCNSFSVCGDAELGVDPSDLGFYFGLIHKKIAKISVVGVLNPKASIKGFCFIPKWKMGKVSFCIKPAVKGEIEFFSFLKAGSFEAELGGEKCF